MSPEKVKQGKSSFKTTADSITSASSREIIKELQRHDTRRKVSAEENKFFYSGGVYSPAAVAGALLGEGGDRVP